LNLLTKSGLYLFGRVLPALIGVGGVALYTRMLDPASVGSYAILLSIALFASAIGFSWLRVAALRLAAGDADESNCNLLATVGISFFAAAVVVGGIESIALHVLEPHLPLQLLLLAVAAAASSAWFELNGTMLQARLSVISWGFLNLARAAGALLFSVTLIVIGLKTEALLAGFVLGNLTTVAFMHIWRPALRGRFNPELFRRLFKFGWPSAITALFSVSPSFQRYTLELAAGSSAVGLYAVCQDFTTQTLLVLIGSISLAGIPLAFKAKDLGGPSALNLQLLANASLVFAVALPAAVGLVVLATPLAHNVFGARFRAGAGTIMALGAIAAFIAGLRTYYFDQAFELSLETRPQAIISLLGTCVVVALSLFLIPRYDAVGAAMSSLGASSFSLFVSIVWGRRVLPMPVPARSWFKTALSVCAMVIAIGLVPNRNELFGFIAAIALGAIVYICSSIALRLKIIRSRLTHRFAWLCCVAIGTAISGGALHRKSKHQ
jgi:O-antigen/teichoic acid export membrane protein